MIFILRSFIAIIIFCSLFSCSHDFTDSRLSRDVVKDAIIKKRVTKNTRNIEEDKDAPSIPRVSKMIISPPEPEIQYGNQLISFSVADPAPVKDILFELARITDTEMDINPNISGEIIINAKNRPLKEIIDRICRMAQIRYIIEDGVMSFQADNSYIEYYQVGFLPNSQLWGELESNLQNIFKSIQKEVVPQIKEEIEVDAEGNEVVKEVEIAPIEQVQATITYNKPSGIITILANKTQHDAAKQYLEMVNRYSFAQVLIEAKIVEVKLNDEYKSGINWDLANSTGSAVLTGPQGAPGASIIKLATSGKIFGASGNFDIGVLDTFGVTKGISSPRVIALNNQTASVKFEDSLVYFTVTSNTNTSVGSGTGGNNVNTVISASKNEIPVGASLRITPSIDLAKQEITINVLPELSVISGTVADPSTGANGNSLNNTVPQVNTRTIETTARIKSGDTLVIGGLMKEDVTKNETRIPVLSDLPILGNLFKYSSNTSDIIETVIFVKATIIEVGKGTNPQDKKIHDTFSNSVREF
jgi:type II secretory pathway component GspD/PulD (secretin)